MPSPAHVFDKFMIFICKPEASQEALCRIFPCCGKKIEKNRPADEKFNFVSKSGKTFASRI